MCDSVSDATLVLFTLRSSAPLTCSVAERTPKPTEAPSDGVGALLDQFMAQFNAARVARGEPPVERSGAGAEAVRLCSAHTRTDNLPPLSF